RAALIHMRHVGACLLFVACTRASAPPSTPPPPSHTAVPVRAPTVRQRAALAPVPLERAGWYGTAHPTFVRAYDRVSSRWMALCQARRDTDGDGTIEVRVGHHGEIFGDEMQLYLVVDGGDGIAIDSIVDSSDNDRWVAVIRGRSLE